MRVTPVPCLNFNNVFLSVCRKQLSKLQAAGKLTVSLVKRYSKRLIDKGFTVLYLEKIIQAFYLFIYILYSHTVWYYVNFVTLLGKLVGVNQKNSLFLADTF